jgi:hypothetical protein
MIRKCVACETSSGVATETLVCKVHGFCVAGGTDMALCSDLLLISSDAKIGYPPARVWGTPTTSTWFQRQAMRRGFREAVRERDEPFGDHGSSTFEG